VKKEETSGLWSGSINVKILTFNIIARECPFIRPQECRPRGRGTVLGPAIKVKIYESRNLGRDNVVVGRRGGGERPKERVTLEKRLLPPRTLTAQVVSWFIKILSGPYTRHDQFNYSPSVLKYIVRFPYYSMLTEIHKRKSKQILSTVKYKKCTAYCRRPDPKVFRFQLY